jgi:hypothetical protein
MRRALILCALVAGACSAVDNYNDFKFVLDGGSDMIANLPTFGQACTDVCAPATRPLSCYKMFGSKTVPGGMCTHSCTASLGNIGCADLNEANCVTVENMDVCLPRCDESTGRNCRSNYSCCASMMTVTGPGSCAPTMTDLCGH